MAILTRVPHLPLWLLGLNDIPAVPVQLPEMADTLVRLGVRAAEIKQATQGLTVPFTIANQAAIAYEFLFGRGVSIEDEAANARNAIKQVVTTEPFRVVPELFDKALRGGDTELFKGPDDPLTALSLEQAEQWSLSWTTFPPVYQQAQPLLAAWASSLTDADVASATFWPMIAAHGLPFNLLILAKVEAARLDDFKTALQGAWTAELDTAFAGGRLFAIDLRLFESLEPSVVRGFTRFTPATLTLLTQDPQSKALTPAAIRVSGHLGAGAQVYSRAAATPSAWLYALQAAKTSVTVYGIWLGHVYHWHIVTAAMQMAFYNNLPDSHPLHRLLAPQSNYLIPFDDVLIVLWRHIAPATSLATPFEFLALADRFARGRSFFDDDPITTLTNLGLQAADFTVNEPWDQYPLVGSLLELWEATQGYVGVFVDATYASDAAVSADATLRAWMNAASAGSEGNLRGLPPMDSKANLARVLTSLIFRITAHGSARLNSSANPALTFVANFPPCLQDATIPPPDSVFDTKGLFSFLPKTGTIGEMVRFYFTFAFSVPYVPFIPLEGIDASLFFPGGPSEPRNRALIAYRDRVLKFIAGLDDGTIQRFQWPLNIET
jgi:hypothetical protein